MLRRCVGCVTIHGMKTTPEIEAAVIAAYQNNLGAKRISRILPVSPGTVLNIVKRHGIQVRPLGCAPTHALNEDYFRDIDTEEKAYWLGFIAADGCVSTARGAICPNRFSLGLAESDAAHLEAFRHAIGYAGAITVARKRRRATGRETSVAVLAVGRERFVSHLVAHGIGPRKTYSLTPPGDDVPAKLKRHWWRGIVDGDGSLSAEKNRRDRCLSWRVSLCGTRAVIDGFAAFVREHADITPYFENKGVVWTATYSGVQYPQIVARLLYADATVYLPRKKVVADGLLAATPKKPRFLTLGGEVCSIKQTAATHGVCPGTIRGRVRAGMSLEEAVMTDNKNPRRLLTFEGETLTVNEWSRRLGINHQTIHERLKRGDSPERAFRPVGS
jgi:hypothetical protein